MCAEPMMLVRNYAGIVRSQSSQYRGSFLRLYYKLKHQGTSLLSCLLADLQAARTGKMLWSVDIVELNDQIADITRQDRLLTQLKHQGLVDPDIFISRRDALAEQLRAVKLEKERLLESEGKSNYPPDTSPTGNLGSCSGISGYLRRGAVPRDRR